MISVKDLIFDYPHFRALHDISFEIPEGRITALVGPNGAGKTTLFNCLAGLEKPFSGSIHIDGIDVVRNARDSHRSVGFMPDFFGLYDSLTIRQVMIYFASVHNIPGRLQEAKIEEILSLLDLTDKIDAGISEISRGMRQRLAIAQVLIGDPKVLLLDEPASGLDPEARFRLGELFRALSGRGMTLVVSSHILAELEQYADEILIMKNGRILSHTAMEKEDQEIRTEVTLRVSQESSRLEEYLNNLPEVERCTVQNETTLSAILLGDQETVCHSVMSKLIGESFHLYEFHIEKRNMQSHYLSVMEEQR